MMAKQKIFKVRSVPLRFRRAGMEFSQKETVLKAENLSEAQVKDLMSEPNLVVVVSEQEALSGAESECRQPGSEAAKIASLVDLIANLDPEDKSMWTGSGLPQSKALEALHGGSVSATERDAAWEAFQAQQGVGAE